MSGKVILRNACHSCAPSTFAASVRFPGTSARPASSNSAMKGVVFHTSVAMMTKSDDPRSVSHARSVLNHESMKPVPGVNANFHASAATTVIIPYGMRIDARTIPPPEERPVHDHRQRHPEHELDRHRDHGEEHGGLEVVPPQTRRQHRGVVLEADELVGVGEAEVGAL